MIVCGYNLPEDLKAMLTRWGVNLDNTLGFKLECASADEPLILTTTCYVIEGEEVPDHGRLYVPADPTKPITLTRKFKLVEINE